MNYSQWIIFFIIFLLLFNKASRVDAFILITAYIIYQSFVVDLSAVYYYSIAASLNLIVGLVIHSRNKYAAMCSYSLIFVNVFGYFLWYQYYDPDIYDNISLSILALQIITILPKGLLNGLGNIIKYIMAKSPIFNSIQSRVTMHKINSFKKTRK